MKDLEKSYPSVGLMTDLTSAVSRHTEEYNLSIARSNPEYNQDNDTGHQLKKELKSRQISMISLGGALGM